jgi:hypothetical protein
MRENSSEGFKHGSERNTSTKETRSRREQQVMKDVTQWEGRKEEQRKKLRSCGKTETDGEVWLSDDLLQWKHLGKRKKTMKQNEIFKRK